MLNGVALYLFRINHCNWRVTNRAKSSSSLCIYGKRVRVQIAKGEFVFVLCVLLVKLLYGYVYKKIIIEDIIWRTAW